MCSNQPTRPPEPLAGIGGIIFDLDGTLADTLLDIAAGVNHALSAEGLPPADPETIKTWVGEGYRVLMRRAAPDADDAQLCRLIQTGGDYYAAHATDQTRLYPGIMELLQTLNQAAVPMAVLSNKPDPITKPTIDAICPGIRFHAIIGYRDEASRKPDPALALEIARRMSLPPNRVLFVGDSATDIATARNAGMPSFAVTWGFRSREQLQAAAPDGLIDSPQKLLRLLGLTC
jgi:phosphoglycolate phosphatase